jgi:hypothetical protein
MKTAGMERKEFQEFPKKRRRLLEESLLIVGRKLSTCRREMDYGGSCGNPFFIAEARSGEYFTLKKGNLRFTV